MARHGPAKITFFISVMVFVPLLFAFLLGEAYIRIRKDHVTPESLRAQSLQYAPSLFARYVFPAREQIIEDRGWTINAMGYRGDDFAEVKEPGSIRVMVFGGSAAFDQNLPNGEDWPARIETLLREKGVANIEVINAGIPGHASFDAFGRFFAEGHLYDPDYVILYNAWNDIKYFDSDESILRKFRPFAESRDFRTQYQSGVDQLLCEMSQLYVRLRARYYTWKYRVGGEGLIEEGEYTRVVKERGLRQYRLNLEMFVDLARNTHAVPILVTQARLVTPENTESEREKIGYHYVKMKHEELFHAFEKTDEITRAVAELKGVMLVDASASMTGREEYFSDHVHLSDEGSRLLAQSVAARLITMIREL